MKNVIDLNRTRIEPSLENYNLVVSEFLNSKKLVHVSIEEIIFDSEKCINNLDKFFDITTRIGNESFISTELGLEAISLCKELNIDLVIKKNLFNKKQYVVSNEEVNVGLIAMIAAAVIAIGVVLKKIWNLQELPIFVKTVFVNFRVVSNKGHCLQEHCVQQQNF